jgi:cytochrome P450
MMCVYCMIDIHCVWTVMLFSLDIVTAIVVVWVSLIMYACYFVWKRVSFKPIPGIPVVKHDSFLNGFTKFRDEWTMSSVFEKYGPLVQGKLYGENVLFIADPKLAKLALRDVKGKGLFHNSNKKINALSTFSLDTGPEWQLRRSSFRSAFSNVSLKKHVAIVTSMTKKLEAVLADAAGAGDTVKVDDLFTQLTIGVICEVAFDMDSQAFEKGSSYLLYVNDLLKTIFKVREPIPHTQSRSGTN